jgi:hypothetical protein
MLTMPLRTVFVAVKITGRKKMPENNFLFFYLGVSKHSPNRNANTGLSFMA